MRLDKRNKLLIGGFVLALVVCYQLAIKKTLALRTQYVQDPGTNKGPAPKTGQL